MEAPAELLAALPALATALALLLAWLLVRRGAAASPDTPEPAPPESTTPAEASGTPAPLGPCAAEPAAAPEGPGEPTPPDESAPPEESAAAPAEAEEQAAEERQRSRSWMAWRVHPWQGLRKKTFPDQGSNPNQRPLQWKRGVLTTGPPGKSLLCSFGLCFSIYTMRRGLLLQIQPREAEGKPVQEDDDQGGTGGGTENRGIMKLSLASS
ncbi:matrix-remodeling-associated protein 7 isoform X3 [Balaenoptera acutorostrata]|uniref:Matrix-remodeling-associated protein 7 isoform X3 n=1 Tax=Balaenoptera acutorostrata TaxID=9767 RepID=A0ABM3SRV6_BALAC|nr:matrix-remodeling-associated protein 7 isoform X3 [Balaenoptera acutorostrata]